MRRWLAIAAAWILSLTLPQVGVAQNLPAPALVNSLIELGQPRLAAAELARVQATNPAYIPPPSLMLSVADDLWQDGEWDAAIGLQKRAVVSLDAQDEHAGQARMQLALWLLHQGLTDAAESELSRVAAFSGDAHEKELATQLGCLVKILGGKGDEASRCLMAFPGYQALDEGSRRQAQALLKVMGQKRRWAPFAAALGSAIIPGAGQAMSGEAREGAAALALNAAWMAATAYLITEALYLEAGMVVIGWGGRFYVTNIQNAFRHGKAHQRARRERAAAELYDLVTAAGGPIPLTPEP